MQAFPCETYRYIYQFLDRPSQGAMRLTCFSNFRHGKYLPSDCHLVHFGAFKMLCADATMFKHTGRLNASTGYAGIESMSVPLNSTEDNLDWDQFHEAMDWIKPKILDVQAFFFNSASCWEKLGCLLTHGCEILRLGPSGYPNLLSTGSRNAITRWPYVGGVKDAITPFNLSTVTSLQLLVLQKASNIHHISITFPPGLLLPIHPHDAEISLIHHLRMSNLTSLCLIREVRPFFEEDPEDVFNGWASYWAKEEVWSKVAEGGDAVKIDRLTSQHQDSQYENYVDPEEYD